MPELLNGGIVDPQVGQLVENAFHIVNAASATAAGGAGHLSALCKRPIAEKILPSIDRNGRPHPIAANQDLLFTQAEARSLTLL